MVKDFETIRKNAVSADPIQVMDARGGDRFLKGHIPKSFSVPFTEIFQGDRTVLSQQALLDMFGTKNVDLNKDIYSSCGSGITASVLSLALYHAAQKIVPVYDGSMDEWKVRAPHLLERDEENN